MRRYVLLRAFFISSFLLSAAISAQQQSTSHQESQQAKDEDAALIRQLEDMQSQIETGKSNTPCTPGDRKNLSRLQNVATHGQEQGATEEEMQTAAQQAEVIKIRCNGSPKAPSSVHASPSTKTRSIGCDKPQTQTDINQCASSNLDAETAALNSVYNRYRASLNEAEKQQLKEVQLAWIKYRDLDCKFEASGIEGGSMQPFVLSQCLIEQTKTRRMQLEALLRCDSGVTPGTNCNR